MEAHDDSQREREGEVRTMWPPSAVVRRDRGKATLVWIVLLLGFVVYIVYLGISAKASRNNPPVKIQIKEEPFMFPDVVFCPASGDGCNTENAIDCLPMDWTISELKGLRNMTQDPTPAPTISPTIAPTTAQPTLLPTPTPTTEPTPLATLPPTPVETGQPAVTPTTPTPTPFMESPPPTVIPTPSPTMPPLPSIRVSFETTAQDWCPRVPLSSTLTIETGDVRSLHVSLYLLWDDKEDNSSASSNRRFISMFFVDDETPLNETVVSARLPYDRVTINGPDPFTFISNDVTVTLSQFVRINSFGRTASTERTYSQATTSTNHTLSLPSFREEYDGAILFVTFNINKFSYQSIEEVDPVDLGTLLGSAGGMWEIVCGLFGLLFIANQAAKPDKRWWFVRSPPPRTGFSDDEERQRRTCCPRVCGCLQRVETRPSPKRNTSKSFSRIQPIG